MKLVKVEIRQDAIGEYVNLFYQVSPAEKLMKTFYIKHW